jgi:arylsulfatase A-like enzyme
MRAPAMVRWPGKVPAGAVTGEIFATYDWLPTLALASLRAQLLDC